MKKIFLTGIILFVLMNISACFHATRFTHFTTAESGKTANPHHLNWTRKLKALFFGIDNPRPENHSYPNIPFETIHIQSNKILEGWLIKVPVPKGTVALFHGYSGCKSMLLERAAIFNTLGYNTLLIDFAGTGGSEGNETTIGYREADDVKAVYQFLRDRQESNIVLFGTSMGAAAILRAAAVHHLDPASAILECPFGSMYETTCARFRQMNVPVFPLAGLLVFWGGAINGFNAFYHNPQDYAASVKFPVLLLYGEKDQEVSPAETQAIFNNLQGPKKLHTFPEAGHENYLVQYREEWKNVVSEEL